jgi:hypothetical protein
MMSRLVTMRPWLAGPRRLEIDEAVRLLRPRGELPMSSRLAEPLDYHASIPDGAGASSVHAFAKRAGRHLFCSVLMKADTGIADIVVQDDLAKREAEGLRRRIYEEGCALPASRAFVERRLAAALAINLERDLPPPFGFLDVVETLGLGPLHPQSADISLMVDEMLSTLPPRWTDAEAVREAHLKSLYWPRTVTTVDSWFEAGEDIETLLSSLKSRDKRLDALIREHLPKRRGFWGSHCAWAAALLKDGSDHDDAFPEWVHFALVARDLAQDKPLERMLFIQMLAEATLNAFEGQSAVIATTRARSSS